MKKSKKIALVLGMSMMVPHCLFAKTMGTVNASALNVRASATVSSSIINKVYSKQSLQVYGLAGKSKDWFQVSVGGAKGYVKSDYLTLSKADGTVTASSLNIRSYPDVNNSHIIGSLKRGMVVDILYKVNDFYKIMLNGNAGFVSSKYIDCIYDKYVMRQSIKNVRDIIEWNGGKVTSTMKGEKIVQTAMKYLGNPYVYGGTSLTHGTDCSGFTQGVTKLNGITIPRTSSAQSKVGTLISKTNIQKGDLLFFGTSSMSISHCGIYIGNDQMIHASTEKTGIIISGAYKSGNLPLQVIRRVV